MKLAVEVDWQKRRKEIIERIQKDEEDRKRKIEKAKKLQKSWDFTRECIRLLEEGLSTWKTLEERKEDQEVKNRRENQKEKAEIKKKEYKKKEERKQKCRKINEFFKEIPKTEAARIASEIRKDEMEELTRMKEKHERNGEGIIKTWKGEIKSQRRKINYARNCKK